MLTRRTFLHSAAAFPLVAITAPQAAHAAQPDILSYDGAAIGGYDPVAYFTQSAPLLGDAAHTVMRKGVEWRFASAQNRDNFAANPEAYAPQYGGYCAYAASKNAVAPTDANAWTVHEGKLYLNYSTQVRGIWSQDIPGNVALADGYWPGPLSN